MHVPFSGAERSGDTDERPQALPLESEPELYCSGDPVWPVIDTHGGYDSEGGGWPPRWRLSGPHGAATGTAHGGEGRGGMATRTRDSGSGLETSSYDYRTVFKIIPPPVLEI